MWKKTLLSSVVITLGVIGSVHASDYVCWARVSALAGAKHEQKVRKYKVYQKPVRDWQACYAWAEEELFDHMVFWGYQTQRTQAYGRIKEKLYHRIDHIELQLRDDHGVLTSGFLPENQSSGWMWW